MQQLHMTGQHKRLTCWNCWFCCWAVCGGGGPCAPPPPARTYGGAGCGWPCPCCPIGPPIVVIVTFGACKVTQIVTENLVSIVYCVNSFYIYCNIIRTKGGIWLLKLTYRHTLLYASTKIVISLVCDQINSLDQQRQAARRGCKVASLSKIASCVTAMLKLIFPVSLGTGLRWQ
jgi:hypothetical protein